MSNYQLYQETLASAGEGTPLWEPGSSSNHRAPSFGDVGYLRFGAFIRLFNAMLPPGHPDNENGEPPNHVPLACQTSVVQTILPAGVVAASGVQAASVSQPRADALSRPAVVLKDVSASCPQLQFTCTGKAGAVVMTGSEVYRQDVSSQSLEIFADYMATHAHEWAKFARHKLMHEVALRELIFVTGCDITKGNYSVTVFNSARITKKSKASFQLSHPSSRFNTWSHSPSIGYFQHNFGPRRIPHASEQCLFIRGFKILDRRAERLERQEDSESWFVEKCTIAQSRGPLDAMLRYLVEKSEAEISVAHDYDLIRFLQKQEVFCDYRSLLKQLKKSRQPIVRRGNAAFLS